MGLHVCHTRTHAFIDMNTRNSTSQARIQEAAGLHDRQESVLADLLMQPLPEESDKRTYLENLKKSEVSGMLLRARLRACVRASIPVVLSIFIHVLFFFTYVCLCVYMFVCVYIQVI